MVDLIVNETDDKKEKLTIENIPQNLKDEIIKNSELVLKLLLAVKELSDSRNELLQILLTTLKTNDKVTKYLNIIIDDGVRQTLKERGLMK